MNYDTWILFQVGPENASLALSLVGFEGDVQAAMSFVFGSTFVCRNPEAAKLVTFNERIKTRSVTLAGDLFDPAGTLTGGAAESGSGMLARLAALKAARASLAEAEAALRDVTTRLDAVRAKASRHHALASALAKATTQADIAAQRVRASSCGQVSPA